MPRSFLSRVWKAVKPPPPLPARRRLNRAQRRLLRVTSIVAGSRRQRVGRLRLHRIGSRPRHTATISEGMRLLGPGDFQGAAAQFTKAIAIVPEYADAYLGRGKARQAAGQSDAALADFEKAIAIDPTLELAYTARGTMRARRRAIARRPWRTSRSPFTFIPPRTHTISAGSPIRRSARPNAPWTITTWPSTYDPGAPYIYRARAKAKRDLGDIAGAREGSGDSRAAGEDAVAA